MKRLVVFLLLVGASLSQSLLASSIQATMFCSNGQPIPDVFIQVYDNTGTQVAGVSSTDYQGQFTISNSQNYIQPFGVYYRCPDGSVCGQEPLYLDTPTTGYVYLNYYPTNLPCSCSHFFE